MLFLKLFFSPFLSLWRQIQLLRLVVYTVLSRNAQHFERKVGFCSFCELMLVMEILVIYSAVFQFYSIHSFTRMLQEDPVLFQLYKDLVVSQVISAEEFWANRLSLNAGDNSAAPSKQDVGISAAFLVC